MSGTWDLSKYSDLIKKYEDEQQQLLDRRDSLMADLPLRFLRQQAHFTTPASNYDMLLKAVEKGHSATPKILEKLGISHDELSQTLGVSVSEIETVLASEVRAPLVMVDGEDAQALRDDVVQRGRENSIKVFQEASWGQTLRFFRPSGLRLQYCVKDMFIVLTEAAKSMKSPEEFPVDGIIFPKMEQPEEVTFVCNVLSDIEKQLGLQPNQIRLQFLVESGWAVVNLPELIRRSVHRLSGVIWGIADYSADVQLPDIINDHPVCDWVRMNIVNLAGAIGVPAIDNMTVNYPVASKTLDDAGNKAMILERLKECYDDALHGMKLGMDGKWVGHPAQLFCVKLAYRQRFKQDEVDNEVYKIEEYNKAVDAEQGATIISGVMSDRATDRHARAKLRIAVAQGYVEPARAEALGIITKDELARAEAK